MKESMMHTCMKGLMALCLAGTLLPPAFCTSVQAAQTDDKIEHVEISTRDGGKATTGHEAYYAIDGDKDTYYLTPSTSSQQEHYRYIDFVLDGLYDLSKIEIFQNVDGSYNTYQIYASKDGNSFKKIGYKNTNTEATEAGDVHLINDVQASVIRVNLSYNSKQVEGNLAEIVFYGEKVGDAQITDTPIQVSDFEDTAWAEEYAKFTNDTAYAQQKTLQEIRALVGRVIGEEWQDHFVFELREAGLDGQDTFEIENGEADQIIIRGNNGVAMASGFNYYLKNYCEVDYDPLFASYLEMPASLPSVEKKIVKETQYDYRYALNYCTYSYTMAFWGWEEYERFLDWAAMSGINTMLDIVGQEEVVRRTLAAFGYSDEEIKEYIAGPGYFAWFYMQNMTSFGGKLPDNWFSERVELGRKLHDRMQTFGITPVLSGFSGQVPTSFKEKYTDAQVVSQGSWCGFQRPDMLRTYVDDGQTDYFNQMADVFYQAQRDLYGDVTNIYSVDPFHEGGNMGNMNATTVYETIQNKMIEHDEDAIWLIQEWSGSIANNLRKLKNLDKAHVLVLDLFSEISPRNDKLEEAETPWIWNMLHNFGGRMGLDGNPEVVSQDISATYNASTYMKGIGMTPEAIENSPMVYELLFDSTWTKDPIDYRAWVKDYAKRRYGGTNENIEEAWDILLNTAYSTKSEYYQGAAETVFNTRPRTDFTSASSWGHSNIAYDKEELEKVIPLFMECYEEYKDSDAFIYDFSDVLRQVISNTAVECYHTMVDAYNTNNVEQFKTSSAAFLKMMELQERVLSANGDFLVGTWIENARNMLPGADDWTKDLFEYNARSLITTWASKQPCEAGLRDYSNRQWSGLMKDYYYPRWEMVINDTIEAMETGSTLPVWSSYDWFLIESAWSTQKSDEGKPYSTLPADENLKELAETVMTDYTVSAIEETVGSTTAKANIALGKTVMIDGAETAQGHPSAQLTDGKKDTSWKAAAASDTVSLTVDLEQMSSIDGIEIAVEQIPEPKPYQYRVEVHEANGAWVTVEESEDFSIIGNAAIAYKGIGDQVRFTFTSNVAEPIEIYELQVFGTTESLATYKNVALHQKVILDEGSQASGTESTLQSIVDGDITTSWASGNSGYPANLTLALEEVQYVDHMELYFQKPGFGFEYEVIVEDETGKTTLLQACDEDESIVLKQMYTYAINGNVKKVHVNIISYHPTEQVPTPWASLAEIKLLQPTDTAFSAQNIASGKPGSVTYSGNTYSTAKLTNGNYQDLENVGADYFPTTFTVDLGRDEDIDEVVVHFEKAGLRFQYVVDVVSEDQTRRTTILDMSDNTADMQQSYEIAANTNGRYIEVTIQARAEGGEFYLASPALAEIEVLAAPRNVLKESTIKTDFALTEADQKALVDGDRETVVDLSAYPEGTKTFTFTLDEETDVYAFTLWNGALDTALQYQVEIMNAQGEWVVVDDKRNNVQAVKNYVKEFTPILSKQVRLTMDTDQAKLADFELYQYDASTDLAAYITALNSKLENVVIGDYAGNYPQAAKDTLDAAIAKAKEAMLQDLNSKEVQVQIDALAAAYDVFLRAYITIDRDMLLAELDEVRALLTLEELQEDTALLQAYADAKAVYDEKQVTQAQLDAAVKTLAAAKQSALAKLDSLTALQAQLAIADMLLENAETGDHPGNYPQTAIEKLQDTVTAIRAQMEAASLETLQALRTQVEEAIQNFKDSAVVVDKQALIDLLAEAKGKVEAQYSASTYAALQEAIKAAQQVVDNENSSLSEVAAACELLQNKLDALVPLDRSKLQAILQDADALVSSDYTASSWNSFAKARQQAQAAYVKESIEQKELDMALTELQAAMDKLAVLNRADLQAAIVKAQQLDGDRYTATSWAQMLIALQKAQDTVMAASLEQEQLDEAEVTLLTAIEALEKVDKDDGNGTADDPVSDGQTSTKPGQDHHSGNVATGIQTQSGMWMLGSLLGIGVLLGVWNKRKQQQ